MGKIFENDVEFWLGLGKCPNLLIQEDLTYYYQRRVSHDTVHVVKRDTDSLPLQCHPAAHASKLKKNLSSLTDWMVKKEHPKINFILKV